MRNYPLLEIILRNRRNEKKRIVSNALRGASIPWKLSQIQFAFERITDKRDRILFFNDNIGRIFPVILDMVASGCSLYEIERQMGLTSRMLWRWLNNKPALMDEVRKARELRTGSRVLGDYDLTP